MKTEVKSLQEQLNRAMSNSNAQNSHEVQTLSVSVCVCVCVCVCLYVCVCVCSDAYVPQDQLVQTRADLANAKAEIETRISETRQFQDLKKILAKKNAQIKAMKARILSHEPNFNMNSLGT